MTTKLYHRLIELGNQKNFYKGTTRINIYHAIAEKAGCSVNEVADLAYDGPHSVSAMTVKKIIGAVGSIQGKSISENEMMHLLANDTKTVERNNVGAMIGERKRWL